MKHFLIAVLLLSGTVFANEIKVDQTGNGDEGLSYRFSNYSVWARGSIMKFQKDNKVLGKEINLEDMNVKGIRAFQNGEETLVMVDTGDEGNSSLSFYAIKGTIVKSLGSADIMSGSEETTALEAAKFSKQKDKLVFTFSAPVGHLNGKGIFKILPKVKIIIKNNKVLVFSKNKLNWMIIN